MNLWRSMRWRPLILGWVLIAGLVATIAAWAIWTQPVRKCVTAYTQLLVAANRQDVTAAQRLCSSRYLQSHTLKPAPEGGIVGLPRNIHKNFQAWNAAENVWLCPTNREGPVFQFVYEEDSWKFDGPIGLLQRGQVIRYSDLSADESPSENPR
jgi:hypothetical protein